MKNHKSRRGFTLLQAVIVLAITVILAAILFPIFGRSRGYDEHRGNCLSNLKQIGLGFKQYIQDYDEKYPCITRANTPDLLGDGLGWVDVLQPYLKSKQIFQCPQENNAAQADPTQPGYTDYWFNARMSGVNEQVLAAQALTLINGDGNDGTDDTSARYHLMSIPDAWLGNPKSPLYRHYRNLDGANYAFADGHAKWLKGENWKNGMDFSGSTEATFRLKPRN